MPGGPAAHDEGLVRDLGEGDRVPAGQRVGRGHGEHERLDEDAAPLDAGTGHPVGGELDVGAAGGQLLRHPSALPHGGALEHDRTRGWSRRNARISPGTSQEPEAEREGEGHDAALGVDELVDRRQCRRRGR